MKEGTVGWRGNEISCVWQVELGLHCYGAWHSQGNPAPSRHPHVWKGGPFVYTQVLTCCQFTGPHLAMLKGRKRCRCPARRRELELPAWRANYPISFTPPPPTPGLSQNHAKPGSQNPQHLSNHSPPTPPQKKPPKPSPKKQKHRLKDTSPFSAQSPWRHGDRLPELLLAEYACSPSHLKKQEKRAASRFRLPCGHVGMTQGFFLLRPRLSSPKKGNQLEGQTPVRITCLAHQQVVAWLLLIQATIGNLVGSGSDMLLPADTFPGFKRIIPGCLLVCDPQRVQPIQQLAYHPKAQAWLALN